MTTARNPRRFVRAVRTRGVSPGNCQCRFGPPGFGGLRNWPDDGDAVDPEPDPEGDCAEEPAPEPGAGSLVVPVEFDAGGAGGLAVGGRIRADDCTVEVAGGGGFREPDAPGCGCGTELDIPGGLMVGLDGVVVVGGFMMAGA
jgi:hypothetical protein